MRLVYKGYEDHVHVLEQTDDRGENKQVLEGTPVPRSTMKRMPIYIELSCDDSEDVIREAKQGLKRIMDHLKD